MDLQRELKAHVLSMWCCIDYDKQLPYTRLLFHFIMKSESTSTVANLRGALP